MKRHSELLPESDTVDAEHGRAQSNAAELRAETGTEDLSDTVARKQRALTAALEELRAVKEELQRARNAKSTFLTHMNHEIRTPLTSIIGFSESLLDSGLSMEERIEAIRIIISSSKELLDTINDMMEVAKVEEGNAHIEKFAMSLFDVVHDVGSVAQQKAEEKGLEFRVEYQFPLPEQIYSDPSRLRQILLNLTGNAVRYTNNGEIVLKVGYDREASAVRFDVMDTGVGLNKDECESVFLAFGHSETAKVRSYAGTGVALYLSQQIAQRLDGNISVKSCPGKGSCFTLLVSLRGAHRPHLIDHMPEGQKVFAPTAPLADTAIAGRVLLAEDNIHNQRLISIYLEKMGATVDIAENGIRAVELASANQYDLVLMDIQMPEMDGIEATQRLRAAGYSGTIVALTANNSQETKVKCREAGCNQIFFKPISREAFFKMIAGYLPRTRSNVDNGEALYSTLLEEEPELRDLVDKFVAQLPRIVRDLEKSFQEQNWPKVKRLAHDLKSTGGGHGFMPLTEVAAKIEFELTKGDYMAMAAHLRQLHALRQRIQAGWAHNEHA